MAKRLTFSAAKVQAFKRTWPASGLPNKAFWAEVETNGDLVDLSPNVQNADGNAVGAMIDDELDRLGIRKRRNPRRAAPVGKWIAAKAVRQNADGTVSVQTTGDVKVVSNPESDEMRWMTTRNVHKKGDYIKGWGVVAGRAEQTAEEKRKGVRSYQVKPVSGDPKYLASNPACGGRKRNSFESDDAIVAELVQFTENDGQLYRSQGLPIIKNLTAKKASGKYNHAGAVKLYGYLMESGAKKYAKELGDGPASWSRIFPPAIRRAAAEEFAKSFEAEYALGAYSQYVPKKYQGKVQNPGWSEGNDRFQVEYQVSSGAHKNEWHPQSGVWRMSQADAVAKFRRHRDLNGLVKMRLVGMVNGRRKVFT